MPKICSIIPQEHLLNYVYSNITHNRHNLGTTKMPITQKMKKENLVHLHNRVFLSWLKQCYQEI